MIINNKKKRSIIALILSLSMIISSIGFNPITAHAATVTEYGGTYVLLSDGNLMMKGKHVYYGDTLELDSPDWKLFMPDVKDFDWGTNYDGKYYLVLKNDGTLWVKGTNVSGELGTGFKGYLSGWIQVESDVKSVENYGDVSCLIKNDNSLWVTGASKFYQLGTSESIISWTKKADNVKKVMSLGLVTYMLRTDNTLWAMGTNSNYLISTADESTRYPGWESIATGVKDFSLDADYSLIITESNQLKGRGYNIDNAIGVGVEDGYIREFRDIVGMENTVAVAASDRRSAALKADGTLWAIGYFMNTNLLGGVDESDLSVWTQVMTNTESFKLCGDVVYRMDGSGKIFGAGSSYRDWDEATRTYTCWQEVWGDNLLRPTILTQSESMSIKEDSDLALFVEAKIGIGVLTYKWYKDNVEIIGASGSILTKKAVLEDSGIYKCGVTGNNGLTTYTSDMAVTVGDEIALPSGPIITNQSASKDVVTGTSIGLYVIASPAVPEDTLSFQWYKDDSEMTGVTANSYEKIIDDSDAGTYYCIVTESNGKTTKSNDMVISIIGNPLQGDIGSLQSIIDSINDKLSGVSGSTIDEKLDNIMGNLANATEKLNDILDKIGTNDADEIKAEIDGLKAFIESLKDIAFGSDSGRTNGELKLELERVYSMLPDLIKDSELVEELKGMVGLATDATDQDLKDRIDELLNSEASNEALLNEIKDKINLPSGSSVEVINKITSLVESDSTLNDIIGLFGDDVDKSNVETKIEDLIDKVTTLEGDTSSIKTALGLSGSATVQDIIDAINALKAENSSLTEQLATAQSDITIITNELNAEKSKSVNLQTQINNFHTELEELKELLNAPDSDVESLKNEILSLQNQIANLTSQLNAANITIINLNNQVLDLNNTIIQLQNQINAALDELSDYEGTDLLDKIHKLIYQRDQLIIDLNDAMASNTSLQSQLKDALELIATLQTTNNDLAQQLEDTNNRIVELENTLADEQSKSTDLQSQIDTLTNTINNIQGQLNDANTDKETLTNQITDLQKQLADLTGQLNTSTQTIIDLNQEVAILNVTILELQSKIQATLDKLTDYEGADLLEKIDDLIAKKEELNTNLTLETEKNNQLNTQLITVTNLVNTLQSEIDRLKGVLSDKDAEIERLNQLIINKDTELLKSNDSIAQKNTEITNLTNQNNALQATIDSLTNGNPELKELQDLIKSLQDEITRLNTELANAGSSGEELALIKDKLTQIEQELLNKQKELLDAQNEIAILKERASNSNSSSGSSSNNSPTEVKKDEVVVAPAPTGIVNNIVDKTVVEPTSNKIEAQTGWEISNSLDSSAKWGDSLMAQDDGYTGVYTFYNDGLNKSVNSLGTNMMVPLAVDSPKSDYVKYTFYARQKSAPDRIYTCDVDIKKSDYVSPITSITSSNYKVTQNYDVANSYDVDIKKKLTFTVNADFGTNGRKGIYYQVVKENEDFDPDGTWKLIKENSFTVDIPKEPSRVYVKSVDNAENYTVDKTVGFKQYSKAIEKEKSKTIKKTNVPMLNLYKTIELGNKYNLILANIKKDMKVTYESTNSKVAQVDKNGIINTKKVGNATINGTVKSMDGEYKFSVKVSVVKGEFPKTLNLKPFEKVDSINGPALIIYKLVDKGDSTKINISGISKDATVRYLSKDKSVATVDKSGKIKGIKKGSTTVFATIKDNNKTYSYVMKVRVTDGTKDNSMWDYLQK